mmetsp:Transcript_17109/g.68886  ORF Transcript_17109/g.68886 Transcript_17109/m.68886 type:complete len:249 (+) Transcript_17109:312-1058(+)
MELEEPVGTAGEGRREGRVVDVVEPEKAERIAQRRVALRGIDERLVAHAVVPPRHAPLQRAVRDVELKFERRDRPERLVGEREGVRRREGVLLRSVGRVRRHRQVRAEAREVVRGGHHERGLPDEVHDAHAARDRPFRELDHALLEPRGVPVAPDLVVVQHEADDARRGPRHLGDPREDALDALRPDRDVAFVLDLLADDLASRLAVEEPHSEVAAAALVRENQEPRRAVVTDGRGRGPGGRGRGGRR